MKQIGLVITRMVAGGASKIIRQLIEGGHQQYNFTLFTGPEDIGSDELDDLKCTCSIVIIPNLVRNIHPTQDAKAYRELKQEFRKSKFAVIHTHTSKAGILGRLAAAKAQVPCIIHSPHGTIFTANNRIEGIPEFSMGKKLLQQIERFAGRKNTFLTVLSNHEKEICLQLGFSRPDNTIVIPNGIDPEQFSFPPEFRQQIRSELNFKDEEIIIISLGRLSPEKGHAVLIDAFAEASRKNQQLKLILVGDGPEKASLQTQAEPLLSSGRMTMPGHSDKVRKYLALADIFVLPSLYEGFGLAAVEAMAAGLPVIASDVGGMPEIITDQEEGCLVKPKNPHKLSDTIINLSKAPEARLQMGEKGKARARIFTIEKMLNSYYKLYDQPTENS